MRRTQWSNEMRQHELAETPLGIVTRGYLGGAKHGFRFGGCAVLKKNTCTFFIVLKSAKNHPKLIIFELFPIFCTTTDVWVELDPEDRPPSIPKLAC